MNGYTSNSRLLNTIILLFFSLVSITDIILSRPCCHHPKVLLISFDGFRWDYLDRTSTPNFDYVIYNGVHATKGIKNAFITKTLPNHYSIVTGLYEESHGMVANEMYDPVFKEVFELSNKTQAMESKWFDNGGEPVWVTNQKRSEIHRTGVVFWPGDSASVKGYLPSQYLPYNPSTPNETRVDFIIDWFTTKQPINLGLLYFEEPDGFGHWFGPDSQQMTNMIGGLDGVLGYLLHRLNDTDLLNEVDIIITSDHGMAETPKNKVIDLDQFIDKYSYRFFSGNPIGNILPNAGVSVAEMMKNLSKIQHAKVYEKSDIPDRYHYKSNRRIQPILIVPDEGFSLTYNGSSISNGQHGYDNELSDMHPFFMAMGPSFKKGYKKDTFHTVDIYPLICHILGAEAAPNNGSLAAVMDLLIKEENQEKSSDFTMVITMSLLAVVVCVSVVFSVGVCLLQRVQRQRMMVSMSALSAETNSHNSNLKYNSDKQIKSPLLASDSEEEF